MNNKYLYSNYNFFKIYWFISFIFTNRLFLVQKIGIEQSFSGVVTIVINYLYLPSFFDTKQDNSLFFNAKLFENILLQGISVLVGAKIIVISCFNLKKIYLNRFKKINNVINFSNFKNSTFCHVISLYVLTILVYSKHNAKFLVDYIKLELKSTRKHNTFILFLKNLLSFVLVLPNKKGWNIVGIRVLFSGRFNGHNRGRSKQLRLGIIGLQSFKHYIDYNSSFCVTKFGVFGIKVWLNYKQL